jgi:magnesium-transporting ATPase (P-type)
LKKAVITAAGEKTETPLQKKLDKLAKCLLLIYFFSLILFLISYWIYWICCCWFGTYIAFSILDYPIG